MKSKRTRDRQYKEQAEAIIAEFDSKVSLKRKLELIDSLAESAVEQHPSVIDIVQKTLGDPDPEAVLAAIALLEDYETAEIIPVIRQALGSQNGHIRIGALAALVNVNDPQVIDIIRQTLDDPDPEVVLAAIAVLEGHEAAEVLPIISQALESEDEQIRIAALDALANVDDPEVIDLLGDALDDESPDVRKKAFEDVEDQPVDAQLAILETGIASSNMTTKSETLGKLQEISSHASYEVIMTGLKDEDPVFREKVNLQLYLFVGQRFETYEIAVTWWNQNEHMYNEEMFEIKVDGN